MALLYILSITGYFLCQELSHEDCSGSFLYKDFFLFLLCKHLRKEKLLPLFQSLRRFSFVLGQTPIYLDTWSKLKKFE
jgi:hypothetical protein